ncbi:MAG: arsenate reductase ArsC [Methanobacteriaceae archaeon]|nr:arsenate reductase ArsC [Methanobacteriaceae archaeon]
MVTMKNETKHDKETVLFICTHNSARSQMAEGILNSLNGECYYAHSAGTDPGTLSPYAIKALMEIGIDISNHQSKSLKEFEGVEFDRVITVCGGEGEACPFFPGGKEYIHKSFEDPNDVTGTEKDKLDAFKRIRDEIKEWIIETFEVNKC